MKDETAPTPEKAPGNATDQRERFLGEGETRRKPLGRLRTEEEARLAAEIEKLRG